MNKKSIVKKAIFLSIFILTALILTLLLLFLIRVMFAPLDNCGSYDTWLNSSIWGMEAKRPVWFYGIVNLIWHDYVGCPTSEDVLKFFIVSLGLVSIAFFFLPKIKKRNVK